MNPYLSIDLGIPSGVFLYSFYMLEIPWPETAPYSSEPDFQLKIINLGWSSIRQVVIGKLDVIVDNTVLWSSEVVSVPDIKNGHVLWRIVGINRKDFHPIASLLPKKFTDEIAKKQAIVLSEWTPDVPDSVLGGILEKGTALYFTPVRGGFSLAELFNNPGLEEQIKVSFGFIEGKLKFAIGGSPRLSTTPEEAARRAYDVWLKKVLRNIRQDQVDELDQLLNMPDVEKRIEQFANHLKIESNILITERMSEL